MHLDTAVKEPCATLSPIEIDAIGEVLNISMGSAATAVSTMLDKQVIITTPRVSVEPLGLVEYSALEPALSVKITYTEGLKGSNVLVFRQRDMQLILNQLMGIDEPPSDDFILDELSMSAACEVMNQMMGASATALSEFLGKAVNISTPAANIITNDYTFVDAVGMNENDDIVSIHFNMDIQGVMTSEFVSAMPCDLARSMVGAFLNSSSEDSNSQQQSSTPPQQPVPQQAQPSIAAQQPTPPIAQQPQPQSPPSAVQPPVMPPQQVPPQAPLPAGGTPGYPPPYYPPYPPYTSSGVPGYPPPYYPPYQPYPPYPANPAQSEANSQPPVMVQNVQLPQFGKSAPSSEPVLGGNTELLMNVPLDVTIEIGQARRKIKDIMAFAQGTVIELEKQAGAPVDIVVNGQLIAHGDVVVIDDNFGVRITEILGTRALLSSLEKEVI